MSCWIECTGPFFYIDTVGQSLSKFYLNAGNHPMIQVCGYAHYPTLVMSAPTSTCQCIRIPNHYQPIKQTAPLTVSSCHQPLRTMSCRQQPVRTVDMI